jgi:hypothetical protein
LCWLVQRVTLKKVDSKNVFASASITTPVVKPAAGHFTETFQNNILQFFDQNFANT